MIRRREEESDGENTVWRKAAEVRRGTIAISAVDKVLERDRDDKGR